jgi:membrane associated rhomboid family serine protease
VPGDRIFWAFVFLLAWLARSKRAGPAFQRAARASAGLGTLLFTFAWPLGPEDRVVRRHPWVTYAIAGACVTVFQLQLALAPGPDLQAEYQRAYSDAVTYSLERPYLAVPASLAWEMRRTGERGAEVVTWRERPDAAAQALEQAALDSKSEALYQLRRQWPEVSWGNVAARSTWRSRLSRTFVHGDWLHLVGNMIFFFAFAPFLEDVYGRFLFALLYLGSAWVSGGLSSMAHSGTYACSVGASGAVSGVMGAYLVRFWNRRMGLLSLPLLWLLVLKLRVSVPTCAFLLFFFACNVTGLLDDIPGVGWMAHIGGFLFGVWFAVLLLLTGIETRLVQPSIEARISFRQHPGVLRSFALRTKGQFERALRAVEEAVVERPRDTSVLREAYDASVAAGRFDRAATHATRLLALLSTRTAPNDLEEAVRFVREVRGALGPATPARFVFAAGDCLERQGQRDEALRLYEGLLSHPEAPVARRASARQARLQAAERMLAHRLESA